jgi:hypothetical protein
LIDARSELFELAVRSGLKVLEAVLEEDRTAMCRAMPTWPNAVLRAPAR